MDPVLAFTLHIGRGKPEVLLLTYQSQVRTQVPTLDELLQKIERAHQQARGIVSLSFFYNDQRRYTLSSLVQEETTDFVHRCQPRLVQLCTVHQIPVHPVLTQTGIGA